MIRGFQNFYIHRGLVTILLLIHFLLGFTSTFYKSPTADEYSYIATGAIYVKTWDFRLDRTHPPLIRLLIGLPLQFVQLHFPPLQEELWDTPESYFHGYPLGWTLLLGGQNRWETILRLARLPILLLSTGLAFLIYLWAKDLYGEIGALISLIFYCFCPNMLAHAGLATMDLGICFFYCLTLYLFYRYSKSRRLRDLLLTGFLLGCALAAKVTALLLIPILLIALFWTIISSENPLKNFNIKLYLQRTTLLLGIAVFTLLLIYGFPFRKCYYLDTLSNVFFKSLSSGGGDGEIPGMPHRNYAFYLWGQYSSSGWPYYFLIASLIKTPLAVWIMLLLVLLFVQKKWLGLPDFLIVGGFVILHVAAMFNRVNIGLRHVLPFYPLLYLYLGRIGYLLLIPSKMDLDPSKNNNWVASDVEMMEEEYSSPKVWGRLGGGCQTTTSTPLSLLLIFGGRKPITIVWILGIVLLGLWYVGANIWIYPNYLTYFNELAGGTEHGHQFLDDSNIDWGQDLGQFQEIQNKYPQEPLYVATNWMFIPRAFHVDAKILQEDQIAAPPKGIIAVGKHWAIRHRLHSRSPYYFDWLEKYQPIGNIGHSMWVFKF